MSNLISATAWVRRGAKRGAQDVHDLTEPRFGITGIATQHPKKYVLDEKELERVSALARVELEDARVELEHASKLAHSMGKDQDLDDEGKDGDWEEYATFSNICSSYFY